MLNKNITFVVSKNGVGEEARKQNHEEVERETRIVSNVNGWVEGLEKNRRKMSRGEEK